MLVAVGGSGKKTLCTLAAALAGSALVNFNDKVTFAKQAKSLGTSFPGGNNNNSAGS